MCRVLHKVLEYRSDSIFAQILFTVEEVNKQLKGTKVLG
jgi:hypothetical protein